MSANISWTTEAETKLKEIPFFVRPAARKKIEKFAQEQGNNEITVEIYERAKQKFGWFFNLPTSNIHQIEITSNYCVGHCQPYL